MSEELSALTSPLSLGLKCFRIFLGVSCMGNENTSQIWPAAFLPLVWDFSQVCCSSELSWLPEQPVHPTNTCKQQ